MIHKNLIRTLLCTAGLMGCTLAPAGAATLFMDNFDATGPGGPNDQITNPGRQSGDLATLGYLQRGNVQIGNTATLPPSPGNDLGDELLTAFGGVAMIDHDFSTTTVPLEVSWLGLVSDRNGGTTDDWTSIIIGSSSGVSFVTGSNVDSILMRVAGGTQIFDHGAATTGATGPASAMNTWTEYKVIISDTAGTGSAWGTGGTRIDYYMSGTFVGTANLTQLTAGNGYIGFSANKINGYDNVKISTVPETSTAVAGIFGLAGLAMVRRRK